MGKVNWIQCEKKWKTIENTENFWKKFKKANAFDEGNNLETTWK